MNDKEQIGLYHSEIARLKIELDAVNASLSKAYTNLDYAKTQKAEEVKQALEASRRTDDDREFQKICRDELGKIKTEAESAQNKLNLILDDIAQKESIVRILKEEIEDLNIAHDEVFEMHFQKKESLKWTNDTLKQLNVQVKKQERVLSDLEKAIAEKTKFITEEGLRLDAANKELEKREKTLQDFDKVLDLRLHRVNTVNKQLGRDIIITKPQ